MAKKGYEIDERAWNIIKTNVLDLGKYFPTPQDRKMYERKVIEMLEKVKAEIKEKVQIDGRADNTAAGTGANTAASN